MTPKLEFFPDFFVVGAPRCGTTFLSRHLGKNPEICFSVPKEPHYFTKVGSSAPQYSLSKDYLERFFPHYQPRVHKRVGEGSVSYLYSAEALRRIREINPEARFIVSVRNPIDMLHSYHARLFLLREEDQGDFARAWDLQQARAGGEHIPRLCMDAGVLQYRQVGSLGKYVEQLFAIAGRDRCLVLLFEDLIGDSLAVYRQVLDFVGAGYDGRTQFRQKLSSRTWRYLWLHQLLYRPPGTVARFVENAEKRVRSKRKKKSLLKKTRKRLLRWNTLEQRPAPMTPDMQARLQAVFEPDIRRLEELLHRDLGHWT